MKCLLCGSENNKFIFIFKGKDIYLEALGVNNFSLKWYECHNCGVYFSRQHRGIEQVYADVNLYDAQYDKAKIKLRFRKIMSLKEGESDNFFRVERVKGFHQWYVKIFRFRKKKYRILDIGAGTGVFLARFLDNRYQGYAAEMNKIAAGHLKEELKIKVYAVPVQRLCLQKKFDIITLNKVLEHIAKPMPVLKSAKDILEKSGILYLELPDALNFKYYGNTNQAFASGHYMVFSPESIFFLVKKTGWEILKLKRIVEPSGKITIYAFLTRKDNAIL